MAARQLVVGYAVEQGAIQPTMLIHESLAPLNVLFGTSFKHDDLLEDCMAHWARMIRGAV